MSTPDASSERVLPRLWLARIDAPLPGEAAAWLDADERDRLSRVVQAGARRTRTVAWSLRRWALTGARPDIAPEVWRFSLGRHGKPELAAALAPLGLHHNLSHGGSYAAVLVADAPCGVDVEAPADGRDAAIAFGPQERAAVEAHPRPNESFLQHWVIKEAALKRLGTGFLTAPELLQFTVAPDGLSAAPIPGPASAPRLPPGLMLRLWPLPGGHWVAAALSRPAELRPEWAPWSPP